MAARNIEEIMTTIRITAEDLRDPYKSEFTFLRNEDAAECYGEVCGQYYEENGVPSKPRPHRHLVITGQEPATAPRYFPISK